MASETSGNKRVKVGDLVEFSSSYKPWQRHYRSRNPGIVTAVEADEHGSSASVAWLNGETTKEHVTFLKSVK